MSKKITKEEKKVLVEVIQRTIEDNVSLLHDEIYNVLNDEIYNDIRSLKYLVDEIVILEDVMKKL